MGSQDEHAAIAGVFESPCFHDDASPYARLQTMVPEQACWNRRFIELRRLLVGLHRFGKRRHVAKETIKLGTEFVLPTLLGEDPRSFLPRRVVADVLGVLAVEIRNPDAVRILMKTNDFSVHGELWGSMPRSGGRGDRRIASIDSIERKVFDRLIRCDVDDGERPRPIPKRQRRPCHSPSLSWSNRNRRRK